MQTLQAAGAGAESLATVTDVTREKRTYKTGSGGVKENTGKEQEADSKAASRTGDKTVTPDKKRKDEEIKTPVRDEFLKLVN